MKLAIYHLHPRHHDADDYRRRWNNFVRWQSLQYRRSVISPLGKIQIGDGAGFSPGGGAGLGGRTGWPTGGCEPSLGRRAAGRWWVEQARRPTISAALGRACGTLSRHCSISSAMARGHCSPTLPRAGPPPFRAAARPLDSISAQPAVRTAMDRSALQQTLAARLILHCAVQSLESCLEKLALPFIEAA